MIFKTHPQIIFLSLFFKKHLSWPYWEGKYGRREQCRGLPTRAGPFFYQIEINKIFLVILDGRKSQRWMLCWPPRNAAAEPGWEPKRGVELLKRLWTVGRNRGSQLSSAAPRPAPVVPASSLGASDSVKPNHWGVETGIAGNLQDLTYIWPHGMVPLLDILNVMRPWPQDIEQGEKFSFQKGGIQLRI